MMEKETAHYGGSEKHSKLRPRCPLTAVPRIRQSRQCGGSPHPWSRMSTSEAPWSLRGAGAPGGPHGWEEGPDDQRGLWTLEARGL